jgi:hypothetical protein
MTKQILILIAAAGVIGGLYAQTSNFQPPGWTPAPGPSHADAMWRPDGQSGPVAGRPFSGTEIRHTTQVLADGTHVDHSDTSMFYRDAQGRMRNESPNRVQIYDPVAGYSYTLELKDKTYEKTPLRNADGTYSLAVVGSLIVSGGGDKPSPTQLRSAKTDGSVMTPQMVNGVSCKGTRITTVIPAGSFGNDRDVKVVNERWYSDDLKALVKSTNSDPRFGTSTYELTNIVQGHPDASLFLVPTDFVNEQRHGVQ